MHVRHYGLVDYVHTFEQMKAFTAMRTPETIDELWVLEHPPVYTLGLAGRETHLLPEALKSGIPVHRIDRGGQVTYHGPGQLVIYVLLDLARQGLKVRELVFRLEEAILTVLGSYGFQGERRPKAPGVYVGEAKIAALGLRISRGASYHGLSLNVDMDLTPFGWINPCGYEGLALTQLRQLGAMTTVQEAGARLVPALQAHLKGL
jgi:lipoyl(octanoyl) transferase